MWPSNMVQLDIGGTIFKTSESTLTKFDGMFRKMLATDVPVVQDPSDSIFIDRSPKHFEKILNFMRDGEVGLPSSEEEIQEIRNEARYYQLTELTELCDFKLQPVPQTQAIRYLKSFEEIAYAISKSTKNGVLIINYFPEAGVKGAPKMAEIVRHYGIEYDVYFAHDPKEPISLKPYSQLNPLGYLQTQGPTFEIDKNGSTTMAVPFA